MLSAVFASLVALRPDRLALGYNSTQRGRMMELHPHERAIVETFFVAGRQERYFTIRNNKLRRRKWLDKLNHTPGLNERYVHWIDSNTDVLAVLRGKGAPDICYVISCSQEIDRREMQLEEALAETEILGWGTVIGCIPGALGYYYGEMGSKLRAILEKPCADKPMKPARKHG